MNLGKTTSSGIETKSKHMNLFLFLHKFEDLLDKLVVVNLSSFFRLFQLFKVHSQ